MTEEWRKIPRLSHEVSSLGQVRNPANGRILKATISSNGYRSFRSRRDDGKSITAFVHQVMAETFIGDRSGLCVNHIDGNKLNNAASNLELVTYAGNSAHAMRLGLLAYGERHGSKTHPESVCRGARAGMSKLTDEAVSEIRELVSSGQSCRSLSSRFGVSDSAIRRAARGIDWAHVPGATRTRHVTRGTEIGTAKLTPELVRKIRSDYSTGQFNQTELAHLYGVSQSTVSNCVRCKDAWEHVA